MLFPSETAIILKLWDRYGVISDESGSILSIFIGKPAHQLQVAPCELGMGQVLLEVLEGGNSEKDNDKEGCQSLSCSLQSKRIMTFNLQ